MKAQQPVLLVVLYLEAPVRTGLTYKLLCRYLASTGAELAKHGIAQYLG
jgi:hypothetical protein